MKRPAKPMKRVKLKAKNLARERKRRIKYEAFMASPEWKAIRKGALVNAGHRCEYMTIVKPREGVVMLMRCTVGTHLQVHHKTYIRFGGKELPKDLQVLCKKHHELVESRDYPHRQRNRA